MSVTMPSAFSDIRPLLSPGELKRASNNTRAITRLHPMTVNIYAEDPPYDHAERTLGIPAESFRRSLRRRCHSPAAVHRGHHRARLPCDAEERRARERRGDEERRGEKKMKRDMTHLNGILLDGFTGGRSAADRRGGCSCSCSSRAAYAEVTFPETQRGRLELTQLQDQAAAA